MGENLATQWLVQLFGASAVLKASGGATPLLVQISGFFSTYLFSALTVVFCYLLAAGVVHTATDNEFLGRQWHSIGTPVAAIVAMMMLSPMPTAGMTVSQYAYVRGLVQGSELADKLWAFAARSATQPQATGGGSIPDYAQASLPAFIAQRTCAERLTYDNVNPDQIEAACGDVSMPAAWPAQNMRMQDVLKCFETGYQSLVADKLIHVPTAAEGRMGRVVFDPNLAAKWPALVGDLKAEAVGYQYTKDSVSACLYEAAARWEPALARHDEEDTMIRQGWAGAGKNVLPLKQALQNTSAALSAPIGWPEAGALGTGPFDQLEAKNIAHILLDVRALTGLSSSLPTAMAAKKSVMHGVATGTYGLPAPAGILGAGAVLSKDERAAVGGIGREVGQAFKNTAFVTRVGGAAAGALRAFKGADATADAAGAIPLVGGLAAKALKGAKDVAAIYISNPVIFNGLLIGALFLSNADLLPVMGMAVAQIVWVAMSAAWFMILPVGAILIAIPGGVNGRQMLKESLTIVLYPVLVIVFFVVGQFVLDIGITVASAALLDNFSANLASAADLMVGLVTGETVLRLALFIILMFGLYGGMIIWVIKGPLWAARQMGLGHDHLDMGIDPQKVAQMPGLR